MRSLPGTYKGIAAASLHFGFDHPKSMAYTNIAVRPECAAPPRVWPVAWLVGDNPLDV